MPLDLLELSDDACDSLIAIFMKARPGTAIDFLDLCAEEPLPDPAQGRFRGNIKSWWPEKGYGFLECEATFAVYGCDIYINRLAIGLFQKGDDVHFSVELNKEGKPQGKNLLPVSQEAKRRQLLAAIDPSFDLDAYLMQYELGPYHPNSEEEKPRGKGRTERAARGQQEAWGATWGWKGDPWWRMRGPYERPLPFGDRRGFGFTAFGGKGEKGGKANWVNKGGTVRAPTTIYSKLSSAAGSGDFEDVLPPPASNTAAAKTSPQASPQASP
ncbi:unnamed protein product [Amoebophrya sp. A25]|nr:unnamed protein product [Amoebophrya sp. A25]|eukprot:GSA25T00018262001.1